MRTVVRAVCERSHTEVDAAGRTVNSALCVKDTEGRALKRTQRYADHVMATTLDMGWYTLPMLKAYGQCVIRDGFSECTEYILIYYVGGESGDWGERIRGRKLDFDVCACFSSLI